MNLKRNQKWLIISLLTIFVIGIAIFLNYPDIVLRLQKYSFEQESFEPYTCDLLESACQRLENYQASAWRVKKHKYTDPKIPKEVIGLFKDFSSLTVRYEIVIDRESNKITSRLPEPDVFEKILQEAQRDTAFTILVKITPSIDTEIIDHLEFPTKRDYFEFVTKFSAGEDDYGYGCTKSYTIQFSESGKITWQGETKPHCPGPL